MIDILIDKSTGKKALARSRDEKSRGLASRDGRVYEQTMDTSYIITASRDWEMYEREMKAERAEWPNA